MKSVLETVLFYKKMEEDCPPGSILREVKWQYADMAAGGDGGLLGFPNDEATCRSYNYPDCSDKFFQEVCLLMGWGQ